MRGYGITTRYEGCEPINPLKVDKYKRRPKSSNRLRPRSEWLPVNLPKELWIIERVQWERVQEQIRKNFAFSPRHSKHNYLLRGLVRCGGCSARYVGEPCHSKYYYRCHQRCKIYPTVKEETLNEAVWGAVTEAIKNPKIIIEQVEKLRTRRVMSAEKMREEVGEIGEGLKQVEQEEARILEAYRKATCRQRSWAESWSKST